jgi:hypothetical protein
MSTGNYEITNYQDTALNDDDDDDNNNNNNNQIPH